MITVESLEESFNLNLLTPGVNPSEKITGCYIGDLLSWVMGRAKSGDVWLTVMGNLNAIAVASLVNIPCIILTENASLDEEAKNKAIEENIPIFGTSLNSYQLAIKISKILDNENIL